MTLIWWVLLIVGCCRGANFFKSLLADKFTADKSIANDFLSTVPPEILKRVLIRTLSQGGNFRYMRVVCKAFKTQMTAFNMVDSLEWYDLGRLLTRKYKVRDIEAFYQLLFEQTYNNPQNRNSFFHNLHDTDRVKFLAVFNENRMVFLFIKAFRLVPEFKVERDFMCLLLQGAVHRGQWDNSWSLYSKVEESVHDCPRAYKDLCRFVREHFPFIHSANNPNMWNWRILSVW